MNLQPYLERFSALSVCNLGDAIGPSAALENSIRPLSSEFRICGTAVTAQCAPDDNLTLHHAMHIAEAGQVLVASDGPEGGHSGLWGELMALCARQRGLAGTVIDGAARDQLDIRQIGYPVFARLINPRKAPKLRYGQVNVPLALGALTVHPGDVICADVDGILVLPPEKVEETLAAAEEVVKKETAIAQQVRAGRSTFEIMELEPAIRSSRKS